MLLFLVASLSALLSFRLMWGRLERRDAAVAVRRLAMRTQTVEGRRSRPRLIDVAGAVRGQLAAKLLARFKLQESAARLLETAGLKWGPSGLLHRSIGLFVSVFGVVTLLMGNSF